MLCAKCSKRFPDNERFCSSCGERNVNYNPLRQSGVVCQRCRSNRVIVQGVTDVYTKHRGCIGWFFWILLIILTAGLVVIIPLLTNSKVKSRQITKAFCQNCGNSWILQKDKEKTSILTIIGAVAFALIVILLIIGLALG